VVTTPPTIQRRNHGKGHSYLVNGQKTIGVTTALNNGFPKKALVGWAARAAAQEVLDYWDQLLELNPSARYERIRTAPDRDRDAAARRGTEVHTYGHRLIVGDDVTPPDELLGHVDAYLRFLDQWEPQELLVEAPVASTRWGYAGTLDVVADLADGNRWLYDIKTTRSGVFPDNALQLAAYRHAEWCLTPDGVTAMPPVDRCGVVWLRADRTYELTPVDASEAIHRVFLYVLQIAAFAARDDVIDEPLVETPHD
jgi:hypothetical protein